MLAQFLKRHSLRQVLVLFVEEYLGWLLRNLPGYEGMKLRSLLYRCTFKQLGKHSLIYQNVYLTHTYNISAGSHFAVNVGTHIDGRGRITIGDYVLVGPHVFIGSSNHAVIPDPHTPRVFKGHIPKPVIIGSNVWIGAGSVIIPGVTIGDNAIVAAGSVVRSDVEPTAIVSGNPAAVAKTHKGEKN